MTSTIFALALLFARFANGDWEVAVATGGGVELLGCNGEVIGSSGMGDPKALAFDPVRNHLYFSDSNHPNTSIFRIGLSSKGLAGTKPQPLIAKKNKYIQGVAYDLLNNSLFWTTGRDRKIMRADLSDNHEPNSTGIVLHEFKVQIPQGIAIDSCRRYIYWTNSYIMNPTIERSRMDGSEHSVIISNDIYSPMGLTVSQVESAIYWIDEKSSHDYNIQRANLDGTGQITVVSVRHQEPLYLAVVPGVAVYWTDRMENSVWKFDFNETKGRPMKLKSYDPLSPMGIVTLKQDAELDKEEECHELNLLKSTIPQINWDETEGCRAGERLIGYKCVSWACHNYCLSEGNCTLDRFGNPSCQCQRSKTGARCQTEVALCPLLCIREPTKYNHSCRCYEIETLAERIDTRPALWRVVSITMIVSCGILIVCLMAVGYRLNSLRKKPRLKRRYRINPPKPVDHCEIAIENCCNMNICETPCYEPDFQTVNTHKNDSKKAEENKNLLCNMEVHPDSNHC